VTPRSSWLKFYDRQGKNTRLPEGRLQPNVTHSTCHNASLTPNTRFWFSYTSSLTDAFIVARESMRDECGKG
jgi:hypothetical protein